jgi:small GTP-binding protein
MENKVVNDNQKEIKSDTSKIIMEKKKEGIKIIRNVAKPSGINYNYLFKISLIGDSGTGKSSILMRFTENEFREDTSSTIGVDFKIVSVSLSDGTYAKMQIWDTCGSERFKSLTSSFIKSCPTFLLIFDISKYKSFKSLENWIEVIKENTSPRLLCLIGNKLDLEETRQVPREEAMRFAIKHNLKYIEVSAKSNEKIEDVFIYVSQTLHEEVKKLKQGEPLNKAEATCEGNLFEIGGFKNLQVKETDYRDKKEEKSACCRY